MVIKRVPKKEKLIFGDPKQIQKVKQDKLDYELERAVDHVHILLRDLSMEDTTPKDDWRIGVFKHLAYLWDKNKIGKTNGFLEEG